MLLALGSVAAVGSSEPPPLAFAALVGAIVLCAAHALRVAGRGGVVDLSRDAPWRLEGFGRPPFEGCPVPAGYRGSGALVVVLARPEPAREDGRVPSLFAALDRWQRRRRLVVYADSVSASDFSLLHLHLALPAGTAA